MTEIALRQTGEVLERLFVAAARSEDMGNLIDQVREIAGRKGDPELEQLGERIVEAAQSISRANLGSNVRSGAVQDFFENGAALLKSATAT